MREVDKTTSSCTGADPPTSPVLPPWVGGVGGGQEGRWEGRAGRGSAVSGAEVAAPPRNSPSNTYAHHQQLPPTPPRPPRSLAPCHARLGHDRQPALVAVAQHSRHLVGGAWAQGHARRAAVLAQPVTGEGRQRCEGWVWEVKEPWEAASLARPLPTPPAHLLYGCSSWGSVTTPPGPSTASKAATSASVTAAKRGSRGGGALTANPRRATALAASTARRAARASIARTNLGAHPGCRGGVAGASGGAGGRPERRGERALHSVTRRCGGRGAWRATPLPPRYTDTLPSGVWGGGGANERDWGTVGAKQSSGPASLLPADPPSPRWCTPEPPSHPRACCQPCAAPLQPCPQRSPQPRCRGGRWPSPPPVQALLGAVHSGWAPRRPPPRCGAHRGACPAPPPARLALRWRALRRRRGRGRGSRQPRQRGRTPTSPWRRAVAVARRWAAPSLL